MRLEHSDIGQNGWWCSKTRCRLLQAAVRCRSIEQDVHRSVTFDTHMSLYCIIQVSAYVVGVTFNVLFDVNVGWACWKLRDCHRSM